MVTTFVNVQSPVFVTMEITVDELGVESTFYSDDVERRATEAIAALFEMESLKFGQSFYLSKIYEALENVPGVDFVRGSDRTPDRQGRRWGPFVNLNGEYVVLRNESRQPTDISDWVLADTSGHRFVFPEGTVVQPGARLRV